MDIFDAVLLWLNQQKSNGAHTLYLDSDSKSRLDQFLELARDRSKLQNWLELNGIPLAPTNPKVQGFSPIELTTPKEDVANVASKIQDLPLDKVQLEEEKSEVLPKSLIPNQTEPPKYAVESPTMVVSSDLYRFVEKITQPGGLLIIGEELSNKSMDIPFASSIELLEKMMKAMNFPWNEVSLFSICKSSFEQEEDLSLIKNKLDNIINLVKPRVILLMGALPKLALLSNTDSILSVHGQWFKYNESQCMPTFHPEYLNRVQERKVDAWNDLKKVMQFLSDKENI